MTQSGKEFLLRLSHSAVEWLSVTCGTTCTVHYTDSISIKGANISHFSSKEVAVIIHTATCFQR